MPLRTAQDKPIEIEFQVDGVPNEVFRVMHPAASKKGHVYNRLANSVRHYNLAKKLDGVDDEMGFMRLVAAEEEATVAIFEFLKRETGLKEFCASFAKKNKNHHFKAVMPIVLAQAARGILNPIQDHYRSQGLITQADPKLFTMDEGGIGLAFESVIAGKSLAVDLSQLSLKSLDDAGNELPAHEGWMEEARERIHRCTGQTIKELVDSRVERRNDILYADDRSIRGVSGAVFDHIEQEFGSTLRTLYYALAIVLTTKLSRSDHSIIRNVFRLYEYFMREAGYLNA